MLTVFKSSNCSEKAFLKMVSCDDIATNIKYKKLSAAFKPGNDTYYFWLKRRFDFSLLQLVPIDGFEEDVATYGALAAGGHAQPL